MCTYVTFLRMLKAVPACYKPNSSQKHSTAYRRISVA